MNNRVFGNDEVVEYLLGIGDRSVANAIVEDARSDEELAQKLAVTAEVFGLPQPGHDVTGQPAKVTPGNPSSHRGWRSCFTGRIIPGFLVTAPALLVVFALWNQSRDVEEEGVSPQTTSEQILSCECAAGEEWPAPTEGDSDLDAAYLENPWMKAAVEALQHEPDSQDKDAHKE